MVALIAASLGILARSPQPSISSSQDPSTFEESQIRGINARHALAGYEETWVVTAQPEEGGKTYAVDFTYVWTESGAFGAANYNGRGFQFGYDGKTAWMIDPAEKKYWTRLEPDAKADPFDAVAAYKKAQGDDTSTVGFKYTSEAGMVVVGAGFKPKGSEHVEEGGKSFEKAAFTLTGKVTGRKMVLTEWFDAKSGLLVRFIAVEDGGTNRTIFEGKESNFSLKVSRTDPRFVFDPSKVVGFEKVPAPEGTQNFDFGD